ncbi:MAG TPA: XRE family transcriptional regulator, partial [Thermoanaerobaculia bacterium]|nr:XRE family transcriptional regulator [Thermoanaerobaculia bacterium]
RPLYYKEKIRGFASRIGVHPGLVVGQLQHRGEISFAHNREMLAKVRNAVTRSALTDGWGCHPPVEL